MFLHVHMAENNNRHGCSNSPNFTLSSFVICWEERSRGRRRRRRKTEEEKHGKQIEGQRQRDIQKDIRTQGKIERQKDGGREKDT